MADSASARPNSVAVARAEIDANTRELDQRYWQRADVVELLDSRTRLFDQILRQFFSTYFKGVEARICLLAVGGFGRAELFPGSDIDICLLTDNADALKEPIGHFLRDLFDLKVEIGYSVRTPDECREQAQADITIATALFERRLLTGDASGH